MNIGPSCEGSPSVDDRFGGLYRTVQESSVDMLICSVNWCEHLNYGGTLIGICASLLNSGRHHLQQIFLLSWIITQRAIPSRDFQVAPRVPCFIRVVIEDGLVGGCGGCIRASELLYQSIIC